jgi:hypothetical protein
MSDIPVCQNCGKKLYKQYGSRGLLATPDHKSHYESFNVQDTRSKVIKLYSGDKGRELAKQGFNYEKSIAVIDPPTDWQILNNFLFS